MSGPVTRDYAHQIARARAREWAAGAIHRVAVMHVRWRCHVRLRQPSASRRRQTRARMRAAERHPGLDRAWNNARVVRAMMMPRRGSCMERTQWMATSTASVLSLDAVVWATK